MNSILKTSPAVFAVGNTYQIMVPVTCESLMWVKIGDKCYYDESNGIIRSKVTTHRITIPMEELDSVEKYTLCCRKVFERKPYFSDTSEIIEKEYAFSPLKGDKIIGYQIADAHNMVGSPVDAAKKFEELYGKLDFLIMNGDIPNDSGDINNFDTIYEIADKVTGGHIPIVFSRGNHDTRGIFAENIADHTPCEDGHSYFSFKLGNIWGIVLDCGEDKTDSHPEYGNTVCCHEFRLKETAYLENTVKNKEYKKSDVKYKLAIAHVPFTERQPEPFNIEEDLYSHWGELLKNEVKPNLMLCGHMHRLSLDMPGGERDNFNMPCPVSVGSELDTQKNYFAGNGFILSPEKITVVFNDKDKVLEVHEI